MYNTEENGSRLIILLLDIGFHLFRKWQISSFVTLNNFRGSLINYDNVIIFVEYNQLRYN